MVAICSLPSALRHLFVWTSSSWVNLLQLGPFGYAGLFTFQTTIGMESVKRIAHFLLGMVNSAWASSEPRATQASTQAGWSSQASRQSWTS